MSDLPRSTLWPSLSLSFTIIYFDHIYSHITYTHNDIIYARITWSVSCVVVSLQDGVHLQLLVPRRRGVEPVLVVDGDLGAGGEGAAAAQRGDVAEPGVAVQAERGVRPETVVSLGTFGNDLINKSVYSV